MLDNLDRKHFSRVRTASIAFAVAAAALMLIDYLLFAVKENAVTASIQMDNAVITRLTDSLIEVKVPLIVKNTLSMEVTSSDLSVKLNGKNVTLKTGGFTARAGGEDTIFIPLSLAIAKDSSSGDSLTLGVSFSTGALYRKWSGKYSGAITTKSLLRDMVEETADSFFNSERLINGKFKAEGTTLTAELQITNPFPYPVTLKFEKKPGLKKGGSNSVLANSDVTPLTIEPNGKGEMSATFNITSLKPGKKNTEKQSYALFGSLTISVAKVEQQRSKTVVLK